MVALALLPRWRCSPRSTIGGPAGGCLRGRSCAAVYTHYTAVFVLGAQLLWLLWAHPEARRPALLANLGAALAFLPWISGLIADLNSPTTKILGALQPFDPPQPRRSLSSTGRSDTAYRSHCARSRATIGSP